MSRFLAIAHVLLLTIGGCAGPRVASGPLSSTVHFENPAFLPATDHCMVWETVVDVLDDYFQIEREEPVRQIGNVMTEGRIDTVPRVGATLFEPWHHDSATRYERLESTLQSIRRQARVRVSPDEGGFWVHMAVYKELEDVERPIHASAGSATFRNDASLTRVVSPVGDQEVHEGWIPIGRDTALEQRILYQLRARFGSS